MIMIVFHFAYVFFSYCAKIRLGSVPDMWLCQVCRSSTRVLQIPKHVDDNVKEVLHQNGLMLLADACHDEGDNYSWCH